MTNVIMATTQADATAVEAIEQHHAELAGALSLRVEALSTAAGRVGTHGQEWKAARRELVDWCQVELVPHALAEEATLYPAAHELVEGRLLVTAMSAEHTVLTGLVEGLERANDGLRAMATAVSLRTLFESHVQKENELLLPLLAESGTVSLAALLDQMHDQLVEQDGAARAAHAETEPHGHSGCACGETDGDDLPVLDARSVPHAIRHATIFGALDGLAPGRGMVLVAPHDPLPLLAQVEERTPGGFQVDYLQQGPEAWHLRFVRRP